MNNSTIFYKHENSDGSFWATVGKEKGRSIPAWVSKKLDGGEISLLVKNRHVACEVTLSPEMAMGLAGLLTAVLNTPINH